jgi:Zn-finger in ubiquitin-hydrolases and other protein
MIDWVGPGIPLRKGAAMIPGQSMALGASAISPNGAAPRCEHLDGLAQVRPLSDDCRDCQYRPDRPVALVVCLTCGWVACSDDSPNHHARAHYEETDHPVAADLQPGTSWRWCYVHQRLV